MIALRVLTEPISYAKAAIPTSCSLRGPWINTLHCGRGAFHARIQGRGSYRCTGPVGLLFHSPHGKIGRKKAIGIVPEI
jgi:hypothetical protein